MWDRKKESSFTWIWFFCSHFVRRKFPDWLPFLTSRLILLLKSENGNKHKQNLIQFQKIIGQRDGLSAIDADQANKLYKQCGMYNNYHKLFINSAIISGQFLLMATLTWQGIKGKIIFINHIYMCDYTYVSSYIMITERFLFFLTY